MDKTSVERRGNVAILISLGLVALLAVGAVTVDIGFARVVRQQLQNASDAGALAGTLRLDGTAEGLADARATAVTIAAANLAAGAHVVVDPNEGNSPTGDVVLGSWDPVAEVFTPSEDPEVVDTVQVRARLAEVRTFLAPVTVGRDTVAVSARTRARAAEEGGASAVDCYIPLAIPDCMVTNNGVDGLQDLVLQLNPPSTDSVGWARPNGMPSSSWSRDQMLDCQADGTAAVGDPVGLQNGVVQSALEALVTRISTSTTSWDTTIWGSQPRRMSNSSISNRDYGKTYEGAIMVFDGGDEYCQGSGGSFNGSHPLVGFVWAAIYDVRTGGNASNRTIKLRLDTAREHVVGTEGDGPDWGITGTSPPRMVRGD